MPTNNNNNICPNCGVGHFTDPTDNDVFYRYCSLCEYTEIIYEPLDFQKRFHQDPTRIRGLFGGYGVGKTVQACAELSNHAFTVADGMSAVIAPTIEMGKDTVWKELYKFIPPHLIEKEKISPVPEIILKNRHKIKLLPGNDDEKIRSLNLTAFYIEEASNSTLDVFNELKARLRNPRAFIDGVDHRMGLVVSNPAPGWIKEDVVMKASFITGSIEIYDVREPDPQISVHIQKTMDNPYLPPDFIDMLIKGKPSWWIDRYIYGSFAYAEGLVFPTLTSHIVEPFPIPRDWKRLSATDFGIVDPTASLMGAIDPKTGIVYLYEEYYVTEQPVPINAKAIKLMLDKVPKGYMYRPPIADPSGKQRSKHDLRSLFNHYAEYGIYFQPGSNDIRSGIAKVTSYIELGKLKVFANLTNLIKEGQNYRYPDRKLDEKKNASEKPVDKDNHLMDCLRYMMQELPDNPAQVLNYVYGQFSYNNNNEIEKRFPKALQDKPEEPDIDWYDAY